MSSWKPTGLARGSVINGDASICGLDFHKNGRVLAMSTKDASVHLIDSLSGAEKRKIYTRSCGSGDVKFTHNEFNVIMTSDATKGRKDCEIRYLSLYDNRYLRHFRGHTQRVTAISMSPIDDHFLSSSADQAVCLWNLGKSGGPLARLQLPSNVMNPTAQYDGTGLVFGIKGQDERSKLHNIKLFDARAYGNGSFQDIVPTSAMMEAALLKAQPGLSRLQLQKIVSLPWTSFEFSPDGLHLLINTQGEVLYVLDGYQAKEPLAIFRKNDAGLALGACFSADARFILAGDDENAIQIFDRLTGELQDTLTGHISPVTHVRANPRFDVVASACVNTVLWIHPKSEDLMVDSGN